MNARLIYKSHNTCFHTFLPVYFYGMPNGKMMVLFTRKKEDYYLKKTLEWVLAAHLDFWYNYDSAVIMDFQNREVRFDEFTEFTDKLEQRVNPLKTFGSFSANTEAQQYFNINAVQMLFLQKSNRSVKSEINC